MAQATYKSRKIKFSDDVSGSQTYPIFNSDGSTIDLNKVARTGSYADLSNTPDLNVTGLSQGQIKLGTNGTPVTIPGLGSTGDAAFNSITSHQFNGNSDRRIKENIEEYTCDKSILDLPIYSYDYIDSKKHSIGCMAQDLQEICPEIVHDNGMGYLVIEETKLVYLLIQEVKKLRTELNELKGIK